MLLEVLVMVRAHSCEIDGRVLFGVRGHAVWGGAVFSLSGVYAVIVSRSLQGR